jgi:hypothetical protein
MQDYRSLYTEQKKYTVILCFLSDLTVNTKNASKNKLMKCRYLRRIYLIAAIYFG